MTMYGYEWGEERSIYWGHFGVGIFFHLHWKAFGEDIPRTTRSLFLN